MKNRKQNKTKKDKKKQQQKTNCPNVTSTHKNTETLQYYIHMCLTAQVT